MLPVIPVTSQSPSDRRRRSSSLTTPKPSRVWLDSSRRDEGAAQAQNLQHQIFQDRLPQPSFSNGLRTVLRSAPRRDLGVRRVKRRWRLSDDAPAGSQWRNQTSDSALDCGRRRFPTRGLRRSGSGSVQRCRPDFALDAERRIQGRLRGDRPGGVKRAAPEVAAELR